MITVFWKGRLSNKKNIVEICENYLYDECPNTTHDVDIMIEIATELDEQLSGYCTGDHEYIDIKLARRSEGQYYTYNEVLRNLTHELIHAKQLILKEIDESLIVTPYSTHPWEIEAYSIEDITCQKYFSNYLTPVH